VTVPGEIVGPDGRRWWQIEVAEQHLSVSRDRIYDWVRRSKIAGHRPGAPTEECGRCQASPDAFPHVDPPVRAGRAAAYLAAQLEDAERYTRMSTRTGSLRLDP
jgi:hypothetical protein